MKNRSGAVGSKKKGVSGKEGRKSSARGEPTKWSKCELEIACLGCASLIQIATLDRSSSSSPAAARRESRLFSFFFY
ncbi:hypothetical protein EUGRSUZ_J01609 [Eucalyptus grandis]|uniref:Uncharacterized protein n=2 Tax=Eucalyptus grandis TaxID=71139 RepID=A0ACC3J6Y8_EUCGR|nr:hypothetical protein EUGRSUZ_J01609 [Eucalyptus grandis]